MEHLYDYLIVGGGMTADAAAKAIHDADANGRIGIISNEANPPYERPPLSKALWKGDKSVESIDLSTAKTGAAIHLGRTALRIDRAARTVFDERGDGHAYRKLLLATGATPRRLAFAGERVINFRTLDDYLALRRFAKPGANIAVVGGGFIGSEIAASLCTAGCNVTMLFPGATIGAGRYPRDLAQFIDAYFEKRGVVLKPGVKVVDGKALDDGVELATSDGTTARFDVVVAGLGVTPNTSLAEQAGLAVDNGIVVDDRLRTGDADIFAAGDVANFHNAGQGARMRVEHENAAISMGGHAGRIMAGADDAYTTQPYFYSDLFDLGYEAVGQLDDRLDIVANWTEPYREGVIYYLDNGRVRGVLLWNVWGQVDPARDLIAAHGPFDADNVRNRLPRLA